MQILTPNNNQKSFTFYEFLKIRQLCIFLMHINIIKYFIYKFFYISFFILNKDY